MIWNVALTVGLLLGMVVLLWRMLATAKAIAASRGGLERSFDEQAECLSALSEQSTAELSDLIRDVECLSRDLLGAFPATHAGDEIRRNLARNAVSYLPAQGQAAEVESPKFDPLPIAEFLLRRSRRGIPSRGSSSVGDLPIERFLVETGFDGSVLDEFCVYKGPGGRKGQMAVKGRNARWVLLDSYARRDPVRSWDSTANALCAWAAAK